MTHEKRSRDFDVLTFTVFKEARQRSLFTHLQVRCNVASDLLSEIIDYLLVRRLISKLWEKKSGPWYQVTGKGLVVIHYFTMLEELLTPPTRMQNEAEVPRILA